MQNKILQAIFIISILFLSSCQKETQDDKGNVVRPDDDARIGQVVDNLFLNYSDTSASFTILDRTDFWKLYNFADSMMLRMLNTGTFQYATEFNWKIRVFEEGGVEKAFAAPGGYIYISRDMLLFLENEADFAGLLAHTMMVSDGRYITGALEDRYSISFLLDLALGAQPELPNELMAAISNISYAPVDAEAIDAATRDVICNTDYDIRSFSSFVARAKYNTNNGTQIIEWLDMYQCPSSWADDLYNTYDTNSCGGNVTNQIDYEKIKLTIGK